MSTNPEVRLLVTSAGNEFMVDLAQTFAKGLRGVGVGASVQVDEEPRLSGTVSEIVVAPHEYFPLFLAPTLSPSALEDVNRRIFVLTVEQPGSPWFEVSVPYADRSLGIFDINPEGAAAFRRRGVRAVHTPLGFGVLASGQDPAPPAARSVDVAFLGHLSPRRERFLAEHADAFSRLNCRFVLVDVMGPRQTATPGYQHGVERSALLSDTRILLNVHSADRTYFESHRAGLALAHGCVLVSETSRGTSPLIDGRHFVMASLADLASTCETLLRDADRLAAIARAGVDLARSDDTMLATARRMMAMIEGASGRPDKSRDPEVHRAALRQRLEAARATRQGGQPDWTVAETRPAGATPRVSVIVTVHNYRDFVPACLASVFAADPVPGGTELVVVDDASTDDSRERAWEALGGGPLPARLITKHTNTGVADARNLGLHLARGHLVLTLDADNWIYPACLVRLATALDDHRVAAAYPMLRRVDGATGEALGLLSARAWSVRDLVRAPYIDALAMFRRDVLLALGGYSVELIEHGWLGWEDYDLWLKLAAAGQTCVHVPNVLASYREHDASMLSHTNRDPGRLVSHLRDKFKDLGARHPGLDLYFGAPAQGGAPFQRLEATGDPSPALRVRCLELEREVRALHDSWSWRVTAPVRAMYRLLTGKP